MSNIIFLVEPQRICSNRIHSQRFVDREIKHDIEMIKFGMDWYGCYERIEASSEFPGLIEVVLPSPLNEMQELWLKGFGPNLKRKE